MSPAPNSTYKNRDNKKAESLGFGL